MTNHNGNATLFLVTLFSMLVPNYKIAGGRSIMTTIYFQYILLIYGLIYFTQQTNLKKGTIHAKNSNETHYSSVGLGLLMGMMLRKRLKINY